VHDVERRLRGGDLEGAIASVRDPDAWLAHAELEGDADDWRADHVAVVPCIDVGDVALAESFTLGLVGIAPSWSEVAAPFRRIERLTLRSLGGGRRVLATLASLPALRSLAIELDRKTQVADPQSLRRLPLEELAFHYYAGQVPLGELGRIPTLRRFDLHGRDLDLASLEAPQLTTLFVSSHGAPLRSPLPPLPALRTLFVEATTLEPLGLRRMPALQQLSLADASPAALEGLDALTELRHLHLVVRSGTSLPAIAGLPLRSLSLRSDTLQALPSLAEMPLERLVLETPALRRLRGLGGARLRVLDLDECAALRDVGHIGAPEVTSLRLRAPRLRSLDVSSFPRLERLDLRGCRHLRELVGADRSALQRVDLRGCFALRNVPALPETLRVVALHDTPLSRSDLPAALRWTATRAKQPAMDTLAARTGPPRRTRRKSTKVEAGVRKLLGSRDPGAIAQGAELLAALGTAEAFAPFLEGARVRHGELEMPALKGLFKHVARLRVLEAGQSIATVRALTEAVTRLEVRGTRKKRVPLELEGLAALPNLRALRCIMATLKPGATELPSLRDVFLRSVRGLEDYSFLSRAPRLRTLRIYGLGPRTLAGLEESPLSALMLVGAHSASFDALPAMQLKRLALGNILQSSLAPLAGCATLEELRLSHVPGFSTDELGRYPALDSLFLHATVRPRSLRFLERMPKLRVLEARFTGVEDFGPIYEMPSLRSVSVDGRGRLDVTRLRDAGVEVSSVR